MNFTAIRRDKDRRWQTGKDRQVEVQNSRVLTLFGPDWTLKLMMGERLGVPVPEFSPAGTSQWL